MGHEGPANRAFRNFWAAMAAIFTAIAALASLWAAYEAKKAAQISKKSVEIETNQILLLDCVGDFQKMAAIKRVRVLDAFPTMLNDLEEIGTHDAKSEDSSISRR